MDTGIAEKVSVFGVILVRIFPYLLRTSRYSDRMREYTGQKYLFVFSPNAGKYGPEKLRIRTLSTPNTDIFCGFSLRLVSRG